MNSIFQFLIFVHLENVLNGKEYVLRGSEQLLSKSKKQTKDPVIIGSVKWLVLTKYESCSLTYSVKRSNSNQAHLQCNDYSHWRV